MIAFRIHKSSISDVPYMYISFTKQIYMKREKTEKLQNFVISQTIFGLAFSLTLNFHLKKNCCHEVESALKFKKRNGNYYTVMYFTEHLTCFFNVCT